MTCSGSFLWNWKRRRKMLARSCYWLRALAWSGKSSAGLARVSLFVSAGSCRMMFGFRSCPGLRAKRRQELREGKSVDHVFFFHPSAPRHLNAETHGREAPSGMRVGRNYDFHAAILGHAEMRVFQVEAFR